MFKSTLIALVAVFFIFPPASSAHAQYQFGVCDRAANIAVAEVNRRAFRKRQIVQRSGAPTQIQHAHFIIIEHSRSQALGTAIRNRHACHRGYIPAQRIVNDAVTVFTLGLNRALPRGMTRIDLSEIVAGRPLGGPNAVVPKVREKILRGNRGTGANIIRDPIRCLTFMRKC